MRRSFRLDREEEQPGRTIHVSQVDVVSNMVELLCGSMWGRAQKGYHATALPLEFCLGGSCPLALTLMPDTSVSPHVPLVPFQLLPQCWSPEEVSLHKS